MASRPEVSLFKVFVAPDAAEKTAATLTSGYITQGPKVEELERKLAHADLIASVRSKSPLIRTPTAMLRRGLSPRASLEGYPGAPEASPPEAGSERSEGAVSGEPASTRRLVELVASSWMRSKQEASTPRRRS